jgi:hypothetical protein
MKENTQITTKYCTSIIYKYAQENKCREDERGRSRARVF